jgi:hypothetical protein
VGLLVLALAACGGGQVASGRPASPGSAYPRLVAAYLAYARCARSHGMPGLPDPQVDEQGNDHYPALDRQGPWVWPESVIVGCARVWARVHAIRDRFDSEHAPAPRSVESDAQALAVARCIRAHGFPTYPDPSAGGATAVQALPPGFAKPNLSPQASAVIATCGRKGRP